MITRRRARGAALLLFAAARVPTPPALAQLAGIVERMSPSSTGEEENEGGTQPSVSADGRYVAFLSRAWNMYPGRRGSSRPARDRCSMRRICRSPGGRGSPSSSRTA